MRKRIGVCMLAAIMSVTGISSFAAQGAENETEQETGIQRIRNAGRGSSRPDECRPTFDENKSI